MIIHKTYKYRLKPTKSQESLFWQYAGACRWVYNHCLAERIETYQATGKSPSAYDQMKELTLLKKQEETAWLKAMPAQALQQAVLDLDVAYENFFAKRARYPKFKNRRSRPSFRYPQSVRVKGNRIYLPK